MDTTGLSSNLPVSDNIRMIVEQLDIGSRVRVADAIYLQLLEFLWEEAAVLDEDDLTAWKDMLDPDIRYRMPVCLTHRRDSKESYHTDAMHLDEDFGSLSFRIRRLTETLAWATDPAPRTRRIVSTIRAWRTSEPSIFRTNSSLLFVRTQDDEYQTDLVSGVRFDLIRQLPDGSLRLLDREIRADQTTIGTHNLAVFL